MYNSILVPIDPAESDFANPALKMAERFATQYGAVLRLVAVISPVRGVITEMLDADFDTRIADDARKLLVEIAGSLNVPKDRVSISVRAGTVYHEVLEEAAAFNADLILIASHGDSFSSYLLGSNAAKVVRHADCSVLVVRGGEDEDEDED
ncbi:universal stress protein [Breoghania sp.]|uniref:universal stress protein n=1 Tax=Breoghania sp. TaxID=2065378 RepID=UPI002AAAA27C|nr:universal stress protein [Breoghania sp.]